MPTSKKLLPLLFVLLCLTFPATSLSAQPTIHEQVNELLGKRDFSAAEKLAREAMNRNPNDPETLCALACVYRNQARKSAVQVNADAMGIKEGESGQYQFKGKEDIEKLFSEQEYYDRKEYARAEVLYRQIIASHPGYLNAYFNLLNDYVTMEEFDSYFPLIERFAVNLKADPGCPHYLIDLAGKLFKQDYDDQALKLYNIILTHFPDFSQARSDIGAVYSKQGRFPEARAIFAEVYKKSPGDLINLQNYYFTAVLGEDFKTAASLIPKIIALDKGYDQNYDAAFLFCLLKKEYKRFLTTYMAARKKDEKDIDKDFWYQTALELSKMEGRSREEQLSFLGYLLTQFHEAEYSTMTMILANLVLERDPDNNTALLVAAATCDRHQYLEKTVAYLNRIKATRAKDPDIMSEYNWNWNYGRIHYANGLYKVATEHFLKNYQTRQDDANLNHYLGMCYLKTGDSKKARELFARNAAMDDKEQMEQINASIRQLRRLEQ